MKVKIEKTEEGEAFFRIPDKYQEELQWEEGDTIKWLDNKDGSWTLKKVSSLETLKEKALSNPEVKEEYDQINRCITKLIVAGLSEKQAVDVAFLIEDLEDMENDSRMEKMLEMAKRFNMNGSLDSGTVEKIKNLAESGDQGI
jgi:bifunctional DNA-binding transcriptional regulator/antitoxin component of YhaV-PrlF toxin-antitoxin module